METHRIARCLTKDFAERLQKALTSTFTVYPATFELEYNERTDWYVIMATVDSDTPDKEVSRMISYAHGYIDASSYCGRLVEPA